MIALPPNSVDALLATVAELSDDHFEVLKAELNGPSAFDTDAKRLDQLAQSTGLPQRTLRNVLPVLSQIYGFLNDDPDGFPPERQLWDIVNSLPHLPADAPRAEAVVDRLAVLLQKNESIDQARKLERVKRGFGNTARSFHTIVELRPAFTADRSEIVTLMPIVELRVRSSSAFEFNREYVFQTDEAGLEKLTSAIEIAKSKLKTLRKCEALAQLIDREKQ